MEIKITKRNTNIIDAYDIYVNNKYMETLCNEMIEDSSYMGYLIKMAYNKNIALNDVEFSEVNKLISDYLGRKKYGNVLVNTEISNEGNVVIIDCIRHYEGVLAGGFRIEETPNYILRNKKDIINNIKQLENYN